MKRVLLTGMSGTGKSTLIAALSARGFSAVDLDSDEYSCWADVDADDRTPGTPVEPGRDWVWRTDRIRALLSSQTAAVLFVSGCASNMGPLLPEFHAVILLSAPSEVIVARLRGRTTDSYGKRPEEISRVLALRDSVEPLLRRVATHEVEAVGSVEEVVDRIIRLVDADEPDPRPRPAPAV